ncbi:MAG: CvpA family protein [Oleiphilaceae bacterium]|nr:CvpA family protein [Oleiphilaceae bacterium]
MAALIWIDWVIISIIALSTLISLWRGFVREAMSLVIWIGAFVIARTFHPHMQSLLADSVETPVVRLVAAFAILFVATLIVGAIVNRALAHLVRATGLSATDRLLGTFFGLARGLVLVVVALALLRMTPLTNDSWWQESVTVDELSKVEAWSRDVFGDELERLLPEEDREKTRQVAGEAAADGARYLFEQQMQQSRQQSQASESGNDETQ